eukprot:3605386-Pyramimonas_sp.AAC.1
MVTALAGGDCKNLRTAGQRDPLMVASLYFWLPWRRAVTRGRGGRCSRLSLLGLGAAVALDLGHA